MCKNIKNTQIVLSRWQHWWFLAGDMLTGRPGERLRSRLLAQSGRTPLFLINSGAAAHLNSFHMMLYRLKPFEMLSCKITCCMVAFFVVQ